MHLGNLDWMVSKGNLAYLAYLVYLVTRVIVDPVVYQEKNGLPGMDYFNISPLTIVFKI